jgi:tetratricopeptide (TPR) repeat protein
MYAAIAVLAGLAIQAEPFDKQKLLNAIGMPEANLGTMATLNNEGQVSLPDTPLFTQRDIAVAEQALREDPNNPDRYRALSKLYRLARHWEKAKTVEAKAVELYRARLAGQSNDGLSLARYADCLDWPKQAEETDAALRQAVQLSPGEWECWTIRSQFLQSRASELVGGNQSDTFRATQMIQARVGTGKTTSVELSAAQALYAEALRCLDRAAAVAPKEPKVYYARAGSHSVRLNLDFAAVCVNGEHFDVGQCLEKSKKEALPEMRRAAAVAPDDFHIVAYLACMELDVAKALGSWTPLEQAATLSPEARITVRRALVLLRQAAAGSNLRDAAEAAELLGMICCKTSESPAAEACLKAVLERDPALDGARDMLLTLVVLRPGHSQEEALALAHERLRLKDSPQNRLVLAKVLDEAARPEEARQVLEEAVQKEPGDYLCNVALASLLLRRDNPADLKLAGEFLDRAIAIAKKTSTIDRSQSVLSFAVARIAYCALIGNYEEASNAVAWLASLGWTDERLEKVKEILGPGVLLPPPPGIGAAPAVK